jgi:hypothetical protein
MSLQKNPKEKTFSDFIKENNIKFEGVKKTISDLENLNKVLNKPKEQKHVLNTRS